MLHKWVPRLRLRDGLFLVALVAVSIFAGMRIERSRGQAGASQTQVRLVTDGRGKTVVEIAPTIAGSKGLPLFSVTSGTTSPAEILVFGPVELKTLPTPGKTAPAPTAAPRN